MQKSDNLSEIAVYQTNKIGLNGRLGLYNKKAPRKVLFDKWYAKLCRYWTNFYEDFLSISRKIEIFHQEMNEVNFDDYTTKL